jgi:hypothetical protein
VLAEDPPRFFEVSLLGIIHGLDTFLFFEAGVRYLPAKHTPQAQKKLQSFSLIAFTYLPSISKTCLKTGFILYRCLCMFKGRFATDGTNVQAGAP